MNNNKMYITIIVAAAVITISAAIFLFTIFRDQGQGAYIPSPDEVPHPTPTNQGENGNGEATPEPIPPPDDYPQDPYNGNAPYDHPPEPTLPTIATDRIIWHTQPTWDFHQVFNFTGGMAGVEYFEDGYWESMHILGYMNAAGEIVIPIVYRHYPEMYAYRGAPPFSEGLVSIRSEYHEAIGVLDTTGNLIIPFYYAWGWAFSEGLMAVRTGGWEQVSQEEWVDTSRWGFIDRAGNVVIPLEFDHAGDFSEGLAPVRRGDYWGFINTLGEVVIPFTIGTFYGEGPGFLTIPTFSDGRAAVSTGGLEQDENDHWIDTTRWGYIDQDGNQIIHFIYTQARPFSEGLAAVMTGSHDNQDEYGQWYSTARWGFINRDGNIAIPIEFAWAGQFRDGIASIQFYGEHIYSGFVDTAGNILIGPGRYSNTRDFSEGMAPVNNSRFINDEWVQTGWGFVDRQGNEAIPLIYDQVGDFSQGFAPVAIGSWQETPSGYWIDNTRWGLIDKEGNIVIPIEFNEIRPFSEGLAWVRHGELWGLLKIAAE